MREILFRGKRADNDVWIEGDLRQDPDLERAYISGYSYDCGESGPERDLFEYEVIPETVGQYTGLADKNGVKIFEGDLLRFPAINEWEKTNYEVYEVFWHDNDCCDNHIGWQMNRLHFCGALCGKDIGFTNFKPKYTSKMEVIGNIFGNPELLEGGAEK